ncbi:PHP domain-containing protein [Alkaliphilus hydrothermalis]|uniref:Metal-dependent phosphoesterase TrpH n=1 Tax=Alkaliphilus hydrothermalis TaxID=1482730 RepID=A0ABS2NLC4_9FIRM|nr:PHP domain-containing protein [Alkaliphilus hydrothermalis]MBM7613738.1 putative metal-dependent phosphoesterase TrpH [Alkaliphilus hydrothermalis]
MRYIDMHTHTTASDGVLSPKEIIDYAIEKELQGIAITDHDTVAGIAEAIAYGDSKEDFLVIPGIELSTDHEGEEIHILGYMIDYKDKDFLNLLNLLKNERRERAIKIIKKLNALGFTMTFEEVKKLTEDGNIGRPHIAKVMIEKGYVSNVKLAFEKYLNKDGPAFVPRYKITPAEAIKEIKRVGGYAVVAHPGLIRYNHTLQQIIEAGIDGIEVFHPDNSDTKYDYYMGLAEKNGLFITGGSDFHHPPARETHHGDLGCVRVPTDYIEVMLHEQK